MEYLVESTCQISGLANIYEKVFGDKRHGTFVEVGAYDGRTYSNTYGLAEIGWHGLYIEPVPAYYDRCIGNHKNHPNVTVMLALISDEKRTMRLFVREDMCTVDPGFASLLGINEHNTGMIEMTSCTLDEVLPLYRIPLGFDLLVVDTEGHDLQVLSGLSINFYLPRMVIVETHDKSPNKVLSANSWKIDLYFIMHGYHKHYSDEINTIYLREQV